MSRMLGMHRSSKSEKRLVGRVSAQVDKHVFERVFRIATARIARERSVKSSSGMGTRADVTQHRVTPQIHESPVSVWRKLFGRFSYVNFEHL
jgi:hypothetical protein